MNGSAVAYCCQWESPDLAGELIAGTRRPFEDPLWYRSGAASRAEYDEWSGHLCGMACLRMILATESGTDHPALELARIAVRHGAYVRQNGAIKGMIHAPFVEMIGREFGLNGYTTSGLGAADIPQVLTQARYFIASVHPGIRRPAAAPEKKGGHLVLVTGASPGTIRFHNPSGHVRRAQRDVLMSPQCFDRFFAGRGIAVT